MPVPNESVKSTEADAGKVDANFKALDERLTALENTPAVGGDVDTYTKVDGSANGAKIELDHPDKGAFVVVEFYGQGADGFSQLVSFDGLHECIVPVPATGKATAVMVASPGEAYKINRNYGDTAGADPQVSMALEKPIG